MGVVFCFGVWAVLAAFGWLFMHAATKVKNR